MGKHSKHIRRRLQQSGMGGGFAVVHRLPKVARHLPDAPDLSDRARFRLRCVEHSFRAGVAAAMEIFAVPRATAYRWRTRYDPDDDLTTLEDRSRRPIGPVGGSEPPPGNSRRLLIEPHAMRVPKNKRTPTQPEEMIRLETMHLRPLPAVERRPFTAIDVVSRYAVLGARAQATAGRAAAFLTELS